MITISSFKVIRDNFADCTVFTIAHRLRTVMDYDRIMVMEAGRILEFDSPWVLLQDPAGALSALVAQTGAQTEEHLRNVARMAFRKPRAFSFRASVERRRTGSVLGYSPPPVPAHLLASPASPAPSSPQATPASPTETSELLPVVVQSADVKIELSATAASGHEGGSGAA